MKGKVMPTPHESYTSGKHRCPESQQGDGDGIHLTARQTWNVETRNVEAGESFRQLQARHP